MARPTRRWDLWLTAAGLAVAVALITLAAAADRAFGERHALALEGRILGLAHRVENQLRETGPAGAEEILARALREETSGLVVRLALEGSEGTQLEVGETEPGTAVAVRDVDLYLGRVWRMSTPGAGMGGHPGRRVLRITADPSALAQPTTERLLLPATALVGGVLIALSLLGGRLLTRRELAEAGAAQRRKLEGLARAGAGLAHQLRTPLATIKGSCQLLLEGTSGDAGERRLRVALEQSERMERLLGQLLDYARPPEPEPAAVDLAAVARELEVRDPRVAADLAAGLAARVDPEHLRQILDNLVANALAVSPDDSTVEIGAAARDRSLDLRIGDRGPGPGNDPESLFEPYVTRRADGTGLGLPIARALAEANDGTLILTPRAGGGTDAVLSLPRAETVS
ncbi:MAG: HAMP domain-containing histidine kinase [bacterium]|nr:HAMP domain-containing histidine kinase [bacterium]